MNLKELIYEAIRLKQIKGGNTDFALTNDKDVWYADLGNPYNNIMTILEAGSEYFSYGNTPEEAVKNVIKQLEEI